jgi:predicted RNase H-like HicB family nuclease
MRMINPMRRFLPLTAHFGKHFLQPLTSKICKLTSYVRPLSSNLGSLISGQILLSLSACLLVCWTKRAGLFFSCMKLRLVLEHDPETKRWAAFFPELPGCASAGDTEEEAVRNAKEALELWFEPAPVTLAAGAKVLEVALT